jgi:hypothetical protein
MAKHWMVTLSGQPGTISIAASSQEVAEKMVTYWLSVGVKARVTVLELPDVEAVLVARD